MYKIHLRSKAFIDIIGSIPFCDWVNYNIPKTIYFVLDLYCLVQVFIIRYTLIFRLLQNIGKLQKENTGRFIFLIIIRIGLHLHILIKTGLRYIIYQISQNQSSNKWQSIDKNNIYSSSNITVLGDKTEKYIKLHKTGVAFIKFAFSRFLTPPMYRETSRPAILGLFV